jgi:hypothetical protein
MKSEPTSSPLVAPAGVYKVEGVALYGVKLGPKSFADRIEAVLSNSTTQPLIVNTIFVMVRNALPSTEVSATAFAFPKVIAPLLPPPATAVNVPLFAEFVQPVILTCSPTIFSELMNWLAEQL